ncbi:glycoside hydrolase family 15 protein [Halobacteria archaeon AArc-curdl1]|uniref:Glycoside hydrolase family 15 protein n=1 Tax=Natronosalvus hydrolyticus TaxID=2979988 RepID=A0AAP2Z9J4_9EURY|nr:glycoside hydrolase family 15 protein [Halobacteria archaeon AArc-curdl1]
MGYRQISDYSIIGNDDRCALVGTNGSIDWCCFPTLASSSVFGRLLDAEDGGHFSIHPTDSYDGEQRYYERTNVLETSFETSSGRATVTDFMPVSERDRRDGFQHSLYRHLRCEGGQLTIEVDFKPRPDYARADTTVENRQKGIVVNADGGEQLHLQQFGPLSVEPLEGRAVGTALFEAGDDVWFVLQHGHHHPVSPSECRQDEKETIAYWRRWAADIEDRAADIADSEPWYEEIVRSGLVLKLLINEGTGAIYAAATTSLPEEYGGRSNWDYRYNWIRDAKFNVQALYNLGQENAAHQYFEWFRDILRTDPAEIQPVYGVHGEEELTERQLDELDGHRFSTPVRIGNAAADQRQLDIYGAIVQAVYETLRHDEHLDNEDWKAIRRIIDYVCDVWDEKGCGIWEYRDEARHYVHSKLLCWVALTRGIELAEYSQDDVDTERWETERDALRKAIEERGYSEAAGSFVQHFETDETLDATCLLLPIYEFLPAEDERIQATIDTVMDELLTDEGLVHRSRGPDTRSEGPGAFLFCSFWLVDALVLADRVEEARDVFTNVLDHIDSPYLLSERIDPRTGEFYGNFPQAFSHIGLVNSAIYLRCASGDASLEHDPLTEDGLQPIFRT